MDEMKLKLSTKFMRNIVAKLLAKAIFKKTGCKLDIRLDEFDVMIFNGDTTVKVNAEVKLKSEEFNKIMKTLEND